MLQLVVPSPPGATEPTGPSDTGGTAHDVEDVRDGPRRI